MTASRPLPGQDGTHVTFCRICEALCGLTVDVSDGRMVKIRPDRDNPHSTGHVCIKGTAMLDVVYDPDRLLRPLRRTGGPGEFEEVGWDEAMTDIAGRLAAIMREDGCQALANYMGNPQAYSISSALSIRQFMTHFDVWKTFSAATLDVSSRMAASWMLYGSSRCLPIPDLSRCDFLLVLGANPLVSHGSLVTAPRIRDDLKEIAERGRVVVVDPRRTETAAQYEHVPIRPGGDVWLLGAMINKLFDLGRVDLDQLHRTTTGLPQLREAIRPITVETAEARCGVPAGQIVQLALDFAGAGRAAAYSRVGLCRGDFPTLANLLVDVLNIVAGKFGREGGWVISDTPVDFGKTRPTGLEMRDTRFGRRPYVGKNLHLSFLAEDILAPGAGRTRAFFMESGNLVVSAPGGTNLQTALQSLDLFVSLDLYINETNRFAHYILPSTSFLEREDIPMVGLSRMVRPYVQYTDAIVPPVGETRDDHVVLNELGQRLHELLAEQPGASGYARPAAPHFDPLGTLDAIMRESRYPVETASGIEEVSVDLLKREPHGVMRAEGLICDNTQRQIKHPDKLVHLWHELLAPELSRLFETAELGDGWLRLFGRRELRSINSWMHNVDRLVRSQVPLLQINPADADARNISEGDTVRVANKTGSLDMTAHVTEDVVQGAVCYPHGWGHAGGWRRANVTPGVNVNLIADAAAGEALSASSLLDGIPVKLERVGAGR